MGTAPNGVPFIFKEKGRLKGIEIDLARHLSADTGINLSIVEVPFDELIPALRGRRIDLIMSGMSITPERMELVSFTEPYLTNPSTGESIAWAVRPSETGLGNLLSASIRRWKENGELQIILERWMPAQGEPATHR